MTHEQNTLTAWGNVAAAGLALQPPLPALQGRVAAPQKTQHPKPVHHHHRRRVQHHHIRHWPGLQAYAHNGPPVEALLETQATILLEVREGGSEERVSHGLKKVRLVEGHSHHGRYYTEASGTWT